MSKFLQLIEHYTAQLETEESEESCRSTTVRTDRLGDKVKVPHVGSYKQGRERAGHLLGEAPQKTA